MVEPPILFEDVEEHCLRVDQGRSARIGVHDLFLYRVAVIDFKELKEVRDHTDRVPMVQNDVSREAFCFFMKLL